MSTQINLKKHRSILEACRHGNDITQIRELCDRQIALLEQLKNIAVDKLISRQRKAELLLDFGQRLSDEWG